MERGSELYIRMLHEQQRMRNLTTMMGVSSTLSIALWVDITFMEKDVKISELEKSNFKFHKIGNCFKLKLKGFVDNSADESLVSAKLAKCLVMKDSNIKITTILGE